MTMVDTPTQTKVAARTEAASRIYGGGETKVTALDQVDVRPSWAHRALASPPLCIASRASIDSALAASSSTAPTCRPYPNAI